MASSSTRPKTTASLNTTVTPPATVTSFGPVGIPHNVRQSGKNILDNFCHGFPDTDIHSIIPKFFGDNITELMEPRENLSRKQIEQVQGRTINQVGEGHELAVFNILLCLIRQKDLSETLLVMRTFEMDTQNEMNLKRNVLLGLLPNINFTSVNTKAENDFVVLVRNLGIVFIEVKGSTKDNMVRSAEKQLSNINEIVQRIMKAMSKDSKRTIPSVKLILIPDCTEETPTKPTDKGSYYVFKDMCNNFNIMWRDVVNKLSVIKDEHPFSHEEFKELSQILVGIWSAKVVSVIKPGSRIYELKQKEEDFVYVKQLQKLDKILDTGNVRNEDHFKFQEDKLNPWTEIVRTEESNIFRSCNDLKLCYLTPPQKDLFNFQKQAICRGSAGCGKSLLIFFKVLELVNDTEFNCKILLVAPKPHTIRINNALSKNNIETEMIEYFPPPPSSHNVFVIELQNFFRVKRTTLMSYDMSEYQVFIDDLQQLEFYDNKCYGGTTFYDVGDFIDETYKKCVKYDRYLWIMVDVVQGGLFDYVDGEGSLNLFLTRDSHLRTYIIPTVTLSHVMRNSHHIMKLTNEARNKFITKSKVSSLTLPSPQVGHKVTSHTPVCHKLREGTDKKHKGQFIVDRLREVLESVTKPPYSLPLSNVAVIYDYEDDFESYKDCIVSFLANEFGTTPRTIEEQLTTNNTTDIIIDDRNHVMSFEGPIIVYICFNVSEFAIHSYYIIGTRARVSFTIIDASHSSHPQTYKNMDIVLWKPDGSGSFTKYNDSNSK